MLIRGVMYLVISAAGLSMLGACAVYSETRDKQAQEAQKAWEAVDLNAQVAIPRKNMAALLGQQLDIEDELARAGRDNLARGIASGGTVKATLIDPVGDALKRLAGSDQLAAQWRTARADEMKVRRRFTEAQRQLRWLGVEIPDCIALARPETASLVAHWPGTPAQAGILRASTTEMASACADPAFEGTSGVALGGALQITRDRLAAAATRLAERRAAGLARRNDYRAALAEYEAASTALKRVPHAQRDKVIAAAGKLKSAADALAGLEDAFSAHFLSEQKRDALNAALAAIVDRPEDGALPDNASRATVALAVFPDLLDKANQSFADARKPTLVPLLLQRDLEQIKADAAKRDVEAELTKVAVLEQLLAAQSRQADRLLQARDALQDAAGTDVAAKALGAGRAPDEAKMRLWRATAYYLDAAGRLSAEAGKVKYKLDALEHERALAYSESSILQWGTLIGSNVGQMAEWGASGVKAAQLSALINSASLLAIAIGTN